MKILLFLVFKVIEISLIVFIPYWLGGMEKLKSFLGNTEAGKFELWLTGIATICSCLVLIWGCVGLYFLVPEIIKLNWYWVNQIIK